MALVVITRPKLEAAYTARAARKMGHIALQAPLLNITNDQENLQLLAQQLDKVGVIATSSQAIRALATLPQLNYPLWVVGKASANLATRLGFIKVTFGGENVEVMERNFAATADRQLKWVYAAGEIITTELHSKLAPNFMIQKIIVYRATATHGLTEEILASIKTSTCPIILFFSKRSASIFIQQLGSARVESMQAIALSKNISDELKLTNAFSQVYTASSPTHRAMMQKLRQIGYNHGTRS